MKVENILFLAAYTARSQAYAQAISHSGFGLQGVVAFGERPKSIEISDQNQEKSINDMYVPDFSEPLLETCDKAGWVVRHLDTNQVNDGAIVKVISSWNPELIIYSGYGGQLVGAKIFETGTPVLHMHAGWLPNYRGSTTIYYSWLEENQCAVSAILLDQEIDTGPIIARQRYPQPDRGMDVDVVYDNVIRADLAVRVLKTIHETGCLPKPLSQDQNEGRTYYVIHPVLKHLALLSER